MRTLRVSQSASIAATPARVYATLADYRRGHPDILPREYFRCLEVLDGGVGAGTRTRFEMKVLGRRKTFVHVVTEPEPGRLLVESDVDGTSATTFKVEPEGNGTRLTIETTLHVRWFEAFVTAAMLRRIYRKELARIDRYLR